MMLFVVGRDSTALHAACSNLSATCTVVRLYRGTESAGIIADLVQRHRSELQLCSILFYVCLLLFILRLCSDV